MANVHYQQLKYKEIYKDIKQRVDSGEWLENQVIPTERELADLYQSSRTTIRKAIEYLKQHGYLHSEHGRGTFILPQRSRESLVLHSFSDDIEAKGGKAKQRILEMGFVPVSEVIRSNLELPLSITHVFRIKRLRFSDTTPMGIQTSYLPLKPDQQITEDELMNSGSLYRLLEDKLNIKPLEAYESIGARLPSAAERTLLEISSEDVVLSCTRITLSIKREPMEYVEMVYPSSRYLYKIKVTRENFVV